MTLFDEAIFDEAIFDIGPTTHDIMTTRVRRRSKRGTYGDYGTKTPAKRATY